jgi:GAF domain-containing protein
MAKDLPLAQNPPAAQELPLAEELSAVFARLSGLLLSEETVSSALRLVTALAQDTLPGSVGAGVTLLDDKGRRTTAAASDEIVDRADILQYELDEGPCLTAWHDRTLVRIDDVTTETRWPRWTQTVEPLGLRAVLSSPLIAGDSALGAIKVYSDQPGAYGQSAEHLLGMFAAQAAILVANVKSYQSANNLSDELRDALRSRDVIGTAKGILMARDGVDPDTAFAMLISVSQRENKKLRDVAEALVTATTRRRR